MNFFNINLFIITVFSMFIISCASKPHLSEWQKQADIAHELCAGGEPTGCYNLAVMYLEDKIVDIEEDHEDLHKVLNLFQKACDGGNAQGCYHLGEMYYYGYGTSLNHNKALDFIIRSCDLGYQKGCDLFQKLYDIQNN